MHMFETFDATLQRNNDHRARLQRGADWPWGRRTALRHPVVAGRPE